MSITPGWDQPTGTQNTVLDSATRNYTAMAEAAIPRTPIARLEQMDPKLRKTLVAKLRKLGYKIPANGIVSPALVNAIANESKKFNDYVSVGFQGDVDEFLDLRLKELANLKVGTQNTGPTKVTSTSQRVYDANTLKDTINTVYKQALGRAATSAELNAAVAKVQAADKKNPTTTVITTKGAGTGSVTNSSVTTGGIDPAQIVKDQAKSTLEYGSFQAATTYFDAMLSALNGPAGRGA